MAYGVPTISWAHWGPIWEAGEAPRQLRAGAQAKLAEQLQFCNFQASSAVSTLATQTRRWRPHRVGNRMRHPAPARRFAWSLLEHDGYNHCVRSRLVGKFDSAVTLPACMWCPLWSPLAPASLSSEEPSKAEVAPLRKVYYHGKNYGDRTTWQDREGQHLDQ
jgi:hypothetical protein